MLAMIQTIIQITTLAQLTIEIKTVLIVMHMYVASEH